MLFIDVNMYEYLYTTTLVTGVTNTGLNIDREGFLYMFTGLVSDGGIGFSKFYTLMPKSPIYTNNASESSLSPVCSDIDDFNNCFVILKNVLYKTKPNGIPVSGLNTTLYIRGTVVKIICAAGRVYIQTTMNTYEVKEQYIVY